MGVPEYWVYDPEGWRGTEAAMLEGFRLAEGVFASIASEDGLWRSAVLEAEWGIGPPLYDGVDRYAPIRLLDPVTNKWYPLPKEQRLMIDAQAVQLDKQKAYIAELERRLGLGGAGSSDSPDAEHA